LAHRCRIYAPRRSPSHHPWRLRPRRPCRGRPGKGNPGPEHGVCASLHDHVRAELRLRVSPIRPGPTSLCALHCLDPAVPARTPPKAPVARPKRDASADEARDCGSADSETRVLHHPSECPFPGRPRHGRRGRSLHGRIYGVPEKDTRTDGVERALPHGCFCDSRCAIAPRACADGCARSRTRSTPQRQPPTRSRAGSTCPSARRA